MEQNDIKINKVMSYIRVKNGRVCVEQAKLLMDAQNEFYYVVTDLIPCSIDTVHSTFKFYLTADPHTKDSAYIVRKMRKSPLNFKPLGNFSHASGRMDYGNFGTTVKDFREELEEPDSAQKSEGIGDSNQEGDRKDDDSLVESFYYLEMVVMKLTTLLEFND